MATVTINTKTVLVPTNLRHNTHLLAEAQKDLNKVIGAYKGFNAPTLQLSSPHNIKYQANDELYLLWFPRSSYEQLTCLLCVVRDKKIIAGSVIESSVDYDTAESIVTFKQAECELTVAKTSKYEGFTIRQLEKEIEKPTLFFVAPLYKSVADSNKDKSIEYVIEAKTSGASEPILMMKPLSGKQKELLDDYKDCPEYKIDIVGDDVGYVISKINKPIKKRVYVKPDANQTTVAKLVNEKINQLKAEMKAQGVGIEKVEVYQYKTQVTREPHNHLIKR